MSRSARVWVWHTTVHREQSCVAAVGHGPAVRNKLNAGTKTSPAPITLPDATSSDYLVVKLMLEKRAGSPATLQKFR
jgi:hypothetical protein